MNEHYIEIKKMEIDEYRSSKDVSSGSNLFDPQVISSAIQLSCQIIKAQNDLRLLEEKGRLFLSYLKEHHTTIRMAISSKKDIADQIIKPISIALSEKGLSDKMRKEMLQYLVKFGSETIQSIGEETSKIPDKMQPKIGHFNY